MNQHDHKCRGCSHECDCGRNLLDCRECFRCREQERWERAENQCGCGFYTDNENLFDAHLKQVHIDENGNWKN